MPKLKPSDKEEKCRIVRACIAGNMSLQDLDNGYIAARIGLTEKTVRSRREHPETFSLDELWKLNQMLKPTPFQAASIMLGRQLTAKEIKEFILL